MGDTGVRAKLPEESVEKVREYALEHPDEETEEIVTGIFRDVFSKDPEKYLHSGLLREMPFREIVLEVAEIVEKTKRGSDDPEWK